MSHVLAAIEWTVSFEDTYDIGVLNLSLGTDPQQTRLLGPMNYAVERAWDSGLVVVSGGNLGEQGPGRIPKPADDPLVITVGRSTRTARRRPTTTRSRRTRRAARPSPTASSSPTSSPRAATSWRSRAAGSTVDLEHPEAHPRSDYMRGNGTSFAAGVTSGAVALLRQAHPDWSPDQIKGALMATAALARSATPTWTAPGSSTSPPLRP